jgi:Raf kinase inhibitor-like YbhB/YbcL family protein
MSRSPLVFAVPILAGAVLAGTVIAAPTKLFLGPVLAQDRVISRAVGTLQVASSAFEPGGPIPVIYSGYGKSTSFPVSWSAGPPGAKAYAVIVEDPESHLPEPTLHWLAYNIPAGVTSIGKSVHNREEVTGAKDFLQGRNSKGGIGYVGPHPPAGDPPHHYHVQVFALTRMLPLKGGASLNQVVAAMSDRVVAEGELIGTFQAPEDAKPANP